MDFLKTVGTYTLNFITSTGTFLDLRFLLELQNLSGYDSILHQQYSISQDVAPFYSPSEEYDIPEEFKKYIRKVIDNLPILHKDHSFDQYISFRDNWNIDGASTVGTPLEITFSSNNRVKKRKFNTKYLSLLIYTDDELVSHALSHNSGISKPFLKKDESAKARTVIGYDTWSYLRCSYLESFIDIKGEDYWSTLGANPINKLYARNQICQAIREKKNILCIDQSSFDQHQHKSLIIYALQYLFSRILRKNPQCVDVINVEMESLNNMYLYTDDKYTQLKKWTKGLLSGYKFTALLGSLLNKAEFLYVCSLCHYHPSYGLFQGDDAIAWFDTSISKTRVAEAYNSLGFEVNSLKTWYGNNCTEFLREIYTAHRVYGMPSRCGLSLIFDKPKPHKIQPDQYWVKNNNNLMKAKRRGLYVDSLILSYNYRYISSHLLPTYNISRNKFNIFLRYYLSTPTALGGAGLFPFAINQPIISLQRHVSSSNKSDFSFTSHIAYHPVPLFDQYLRNKLKDRIRLGSTSTFYSFVVINKTKRTFTPPINIRNVSLPPFDWNYPGDDKSREYYSNRINFSLHNSPLPTERYPTRRYLNAKKYINNQYSFDDYLTTQETHIQFSTFLSRVQRLFCHYLLVGKFTLNFCIKNTLLLVYNYYFYLFHNKLYNLSSINNYLLKNSKYGLFRKYFRKPTTLIISV